MGLNWVTLLSKTLPLCPSYEKIRVLIGILRVQTVERRDIFYVWSQNRCGRVYGWDSEMYGCLL